MVIMARHLRTLIVAKFEAFENNKTLRVATALGLAVTVAGAYGIWFDRAWKTMTGWKALVDSISPRGATGRKDTVQDYAVTVTGMIASITAVFGPLDLRRTRRNLEQQRELEAQRAQGTALQAY